MASVEEVFAQHDTDNDQKVNRTEAEQALQALGKEVPSETLDELFQKAEGGLIGLEGKFEERVLHKIVPTLPKNSS